MTVVLVHGVPETDAIWDSIVTELSALGHRDVVRLAPPGFGAPLSDNFGSTFVDYRNWLIDELGQFDGPVDLVGHDFGGGHVIGVAMTRPDLIRSWVTDVIGTLEPDYTWHEVAQIWQRPNEGEAHLQELFGGSLEDRTLRMQGFGITGAAAEKVAAAQGPDMARAILALYRSAIQPVVAELGRELPAAASRPGLVIIATEDHAVGSLDARLRGAQRAGAQIEQLSGLGHWWMLEDPARSAQALSAFWARLEPPC